jgi:hypothetical protein
MKFEEGTSQYPVGKMRELDASRETLPAAEVKNKVRYINPGIDSPFRMIIGEPTNIGVFLSGKLQAGKNSIRLEAESYHRRSLLLGRVIFGEKNKPGTRRQLFRDAVVKGSGNIKEASDESFNPPEAEEILRAEGKKSWGIIGLESATHDAEKSEEFHNLGMRVSRVIAIIELEEIIFEGEKISIAEAKQKGIIEASVTPVLEVRAFGTDNRLLDVQDQAHSPERKRIILEDARLLVAEELGEDPANFDLHKYAAWLAKTVGNNVGLMGKSGYTHGILSQGHNITLDGCIVDLESVSKIKNPEDREIDYGDARGALLTLFMSIFNSPMNSSEIEEVLKEYDSAYNEAIADKSD